MRPVVYHSKQLQAWEQRWFAAGNSSYGLMQQAAWQMTQHIVQQISKQSQEKVSIGVWCGSGNNGGDGWLIAAYLQQLGHSVWVYQVSEPATPVAWQAYQYAIQHNVTIFHRIQQLPDTHIQVDALFGIGLTREVTGIYWQAIEQFNQKSGYKIAIDMPSGLQANTGAVLGMACVVDLTLTVLGFKAGLFTGQGPAYAGQVKLIDLIPADDQLTALATLDISPPTLPRRSKTSHKGTHGHVLVIGGDENMGGASVMSAEAALAVGAGKVTLLTHEKHHTAALTRCPNMMTLGMPAVEQIMPEFAEQVSRNIDCIVLGMGLGRHEWGKAVWRAFLPLLQTKNHIRHVVIDADGLWHLADEKNINPEQQQHWYFTPHSGEAARLLGCSAQDIEQDRIAAIYALKQKYGGHWLLKGAGSVSLDDQGLSICTLGNAGMATAGMGDILAGMAGGLLAQFPDFALHEIVTLHATAGDLLAEKGERGLQAPQMIEVIKQVIN